MPTNFKSDNVTAACPEVMEALLRANADEAANSYGGTTGGTPDEPDPSTLRMNQLFAETFECEVEVFPVVCKPYLVTIHTTQLPFCSGCWVVVVQLVHNPLPTRWRSCGCGCSCTAAAAHGWV